MINKTITILSIETSCDETGISILEYDKNTNKYHVLADELNSQIDIHKEFGGVFPTVAKREHGNNLLGILYSCIKKYSEIKKIDEVNNYLNIIDNNIDTNILNREEDLLKQVEYELEKKDSFLKQIPNIDYIAVTKGPGLEPALWVGVSFAKFLSKIWQKPLIPINHMEGHISSILLENNMIGFPSMGLLISGGHTEVVDMEDWGKYKIIGKTRDDAVGEAYDKVARILGLDYPGGPLIANKAKKIRDLYSEYFIQIEKDKMQIKLPRPMINSKDLDLSFSGLKTAVLYLVRDIQKKTDRDILDENILDLICHEFENAVIDVLISKLDFANKNNNFKFKNLIAAGGVISNDFIKQNLNNWCENQNMNFIKPKKTLATDNAVMIGLAAIIGLIHNYVNIIDINTKEFNDLKPDGDWSLNNL